MTGKKRQARKPAAFGAEKIEVSADDQAVFERPVEGDRRADALLAKKTLQAKTGFRWGALLVTALTGLIGLSASLWFASLVDGLLARQDWIGWLAIALMALAAFTSSVIVIREIWALMRLSRLGRLRQEAARALTHGDKAAADDVARRVGALYRHRHDLEWARARLAEHDNDIMDAAERLNLTERELMGPLDGQARAIVAEAAKRVSVLTAISPIALIDIAFVAVQNMGMLRRLASLYGARPGAIGLFRLARMVVTHLVLTGGIAIGDDLLQQVIGHGVTAKLSARLGEGVVNGALTARIGIAAIDVCRPLPFIKAERPRIRDIVASLARP